ncbi:hypothetical protein D3C87_1251450 [compost metagenome]
MDVRMSSDVAIKYIKNWLKTNKVSDVLVDANGCLVLYGSGAQRMAISQYDNGEWRVVTPQFLEDLN